jgi:hypothetical protein
VPADKHVRNRGVEAYTVDHGPICQRSAAPIRAEERTTCEASPGKASGLDTSWISRSASPSQQVQRTLHSSVVTVQHVGADLRRLHTPSVTNEVAGAPSSILPRFAGEDATARPLQHTDSV